MATLESVEIEIVSDDTPDLSFLGEYSNSPGDNAIDRQERGDMSRGEFRYCNITMSGEDTGNPESVEQDYQRLESYNRGDWEMVCVRVKAVINTSQSGYGRTHTFRSPGIWGVESDSDKAHFAEMALDELDSLRDDLLELGVDDLDEIDDLIAEQRKIAMPGIPRS